LDGQFYFRLHDHAYIPKIAIQYLYNTRCNTGAHYPDSAGSIVKERWHRPRPVREISLPLSHASHQGQSTGAHPLVGQKTRQKWNLCSFRMWHVDHLVHDSERQKAKSEKHSRLVSLNSHTTAKSIGVWETRTGNLLHNRKKLPHQAFAQGT